MPPPPRNEKTQERQTVVVVVKKRICVRIGNFGHRQQESEKSHSECQKRGLELERLHWNHKHMW